MDNKKELTIVGKAWYGMKKLDIFEKLLFMLGLIVYIAFGMYIFTGSIVILNSDGVTGTFLAQAIVETKEWFPSEWNYGGDIWVLGLHIPIIFTNLFTENYIISRSISSVLINAFFFGTIIFISKRVFQNRSWLLICPIVFLWLSEPYARTMVDCQYNFVFILMLLVMGIHVSSMHEEKKVRKYIKTVIICMIIIYSGIGGMRYIQAISIPLIFAIAIDAFYENKQLWNKAGKIIAEVLKNILPYAVSMCFGYMLFILVSKSVNYTVGGSSMSFAMDVSERMGVLYKLLIKLFGVSAGVELFSTEGIFNFIKLFGGMALTFVFPILQYRKMNEESKEVRLFLIFSAAHIFEILFLALFSNMLSDCPRYLFSSFFLLVVVSCHYIYKYIFCTEKIYKLICVVCVGIYICPGVVTYRNLSQKYEERLEEKCGLVDFLAQNNLYWGYASYWNAGINTFYSNGGVEINSITFGNNIAPYYWLNSAKQYDSEAYIGSSFLLMTEDELDIFHDSQSYIDFGKPSNILNYNEYIIYAYDYNISTNYFGGSLANRSMLSGMISSVKNMNQEESYTIDLGERWYGPYWRLPEGKYEIVIETDNEVSLFNYQVLTSAGQNIIKSGQIQGVKNVIEFELDEETETFELVLDAISGVSTRFLKMELSQSQLAD